MADGLPFWTLVLSAIGLWFVIEGALYALAPDSLRRFLGWVAQMPVSDLRQAGVWTAALGALMLYVGMRLN
ncbi:MAG: DUF2065 domain-containing protein [Pseudomonadota bacterium]